MKVLQLILLLGLSTAHWNTKSTGSVVKKASHSSSSSHNGDKSVKSRWSTKTGGVVQKGSHSSSSSDSSSSNGGKSVKSHWKTKTGGAVQKGSHSSSSSDSSSSNGGKSFKSRWNTKTGGVKKGSHSSSSSSSNGNKSGKSGKSHWNTKTGGVKKDSHSSSSSNGGYKKGRPNNGGSRPFVNDYDLSGYSIVFLDFPAEDDFCNPQGLPAFPGNDTWPPTGCSQTTTPRRRLTHSKNYYQNSYYPQCQISGTPPQRTNPPSNPAINLPHINDASICDITVDYDEIVWEYSHFGDASNDCLNCARPRNNIFHTNSFCRGERSSGGNSPCLVPGPNYHNSIECDGYRNGFGFIPVKSRSNPTPRANSVFSSYSTWGKRTYTKSHSKDGQKGSGSTWGKRTYTKGSSPKGSDSKDSQKRSGSTWGKRTYTKGSSPKGSDSKDSQKRSGSTWGKTTYTKGSSPKGSDSKDSPKRSGSTWSKTHTKGSSSKDSRKGSGSTWAKTYPRKTYPRKTYTKKTWTKKTWTKKSTSSAAATTTTPAATTTSGPSYIPCRLVCVRNRVCLSQEPNEPASTTTTTTTTTANPSANPTSNPTTNPTSNPTTNPTSNPTTNPTSNPTSNPTTNPTSNPTYNPTSNPTTNPTYNPTSNPTTNPTYNPTSNPIPSTQSPTPEDGGSGPNANAIFSIDNKIQDSRPSDLLSVKEIFHSDNYFDVRMECILFGVLIGMFSTLAIGGCTVCMWDKIRNISFRKQEYQKILQITSSDDGDLNSSDVNSSDNPDSENL